MDSLKDWTSVLEWLKQPAFAFSTMLIVSFLLLYPGALTWFGLENFRWVVAIVFLVSLCFAVSQIIGKTWTAVAHWNGNKRFAKKRRQRLNQLTREEKFLLQTYINGQTRTQELDITNGIVNGLADVGVLYRSSNLSFNGTIFAFNITDFAWNYLNQHPEVLR